jgi:L-ribulose-5-phosphate 4-epimerase
MIRWGITKPIPVAAYGPRGSELSITNIKKVLGGDNKACLLENHGLLAFAEDVPSTISVILAMEEGAQMSLLASMIGKPKTIPEDLIRMATARAEEFQKRGTLRTHHT